MLRRPKLLAFAAGLVSATGFAPLELWPLTIAAFAGFIALVARAPDLRGALARGWVFGFGHFLVGLNWIAGAFRYQDAMPVWLGWVAVAVLSVYLAVYPAVAAGLAWRWGRTRGTVVYTLFFASAWIVTEWLRATLFTGFSWNPLSVVLVPTPADGFAALVGTYGLSALVLVCAGAILHRRRLIAAPAVLAATLALGWVTTALLGDPGSTTRELRIVQPNIGQHLKRTPAFGELNYAALARLSGVGGGPARLVLWPEAAVADFLEEERWARDRIANLVGPRDIVLAGGTALVYDAAGDLVAARNSLFALDARSRLLARYDKSHLVPYGEYLPARPILSAIGLSRLVPGDLDFLPGPGPRSLALPGFGKAGVQICYEIVFSGRVVDRADRPDFLFNPSNDAWFGSWGPPQHLAQARLRAIEEGMPVLRSTPTGISAVVDARGRLLAALPLDRPGFIATRLPAPAPPTPFAMFGNVLPLGFALLLAAAGIALAPRPD